MTAIKPLETLRVTGMVTGMYECNKACAHPDCSEPVPDRGHHIFPRSMIGNGYYFVQAWDAEGREMFKQPIPHVAGLCRAHHDAVEEHRAWIKLEDDGGFVWYDRVPQTDPHDELPDEWQEWTRLGPLDPQPGGHEKARKPKRKRLSGDDLANRKTVTFKLPEGVDGAYFEDLLGNAEEVEQSQPDTQYEQWRGGIAKGKLIVAVLERFAGRAG